MYLGVNKIKALSRSYMWWPGIDKDIESCVQSCSVCQVNCKMPVAAPLLPWEFLQKPWSHIHLDYTEPCEGKMLLIIVIIVDNYSKWLDVHPMNTSTSKATIGKLRHLFAEHGLPDQCVTDNGTCFISADFKEFTTKNGIKHITSSPYHPTMNGQAERAVQSVKESLKRHRMEILKCAYAKYSSNIEPLYIQPLVYHQLNCSWKENWPQDSKEFIQIYNSACMTKSGSQRKAWATCKAEGVWGSAHCLCVHF